MVDRDGLLEALAHGAVDADEHLAEPKRRRYVRLVALSHDGLEQVGH